MGMSNSAVSRLSQTWDKLPSKFRKLFTEFEALIDPSRNHRAYRYDYIIVFCYKSDEIKTFGFFVNE